MQQVAHARIRAHNCTHTFTLTVTEKYAVQPRFARMRKCTSELLSSFPVVFKEGGSRCQGAGRACPDHATSACSSGILLAMAFALLAGLIRACTVVPACACYPSFACHITSGTYWMNVQYSHSMRLHANAIASGSSGGMPCCHAARD